MLPRRRARHRRRLLLTGLLAAGVLYTLFGFFGLPPILKAQAEKRLGAALHRTVSIGRVSTNPFTLSLTMEQFAVRERDGTEVFLGWDRLYVNFELLSLFTQEWRFAAIELGGPRAHVVVNPDGSLNFSDLLAGTAAPVPAGTPPAAPAKPLHIQRLVLTGARLEFRDQSRAQPFATTLGPVGFSVTDFRTLGGPQAPYSFEAVTELGEKFSWHGWMNAAPFRSGGELGLSNVVLKKYAPYYAEKLGVDLADGLLTVRGQYEVNFGEQSRVLKLVDGSLALRNLKVVERASGESLLELPAADLTGASADGLTFQAGVKSVVLAGGRLKLRREADGSLNLAKLLAPAVPPADTPAAPPAGASAPAPAATVPFGFQAGELALRDWTVEINDLAAPQPAQLGIIGLSAALKDFTLAAGALIPVELDLGWQPQGKVHVAGNMGLQPVQLDLALQADGLALLPLAPYLQQGREARLTDGAVSAQGRVTLALPAGQPPALTYDGNAWVEKIDLVTGSPGESFAGFSDLILNGIKVATAPQLALEVAEVNLNSPYARIVRGKDGILNLVQAIAPAAGAAAPEPAKPAVAPAASAPFTLPGDAPAGPNLAVGRVVINGGEFTFNDRSLSPQVRLAVNQFGGTLAGWSSQNPGRGELELKAAVDGVGPVTIAGKFDPLGPALFVDAQLSVARVDLLPTSPYVGKFAGYELARGKLALDVSAKLAHRQIDMTNLVTLDQFTLGRATNSPEATHLPVRLGIALLKDTDGKIVLDLPVQGSLDDPEFKIGKVVWRVIGNVLTKVATSPFALVGAMFGGGGEELRFQEFAPGEATLNPENLGKLGTLVKALGTRPGLNLGIEGNFDEAADRYALQQKKYLTELRQAAWLEKLAAEAKAAAPAVKPGTAPKPPVSLAAPKPRPMNASSVGLAPVTALPVAPPVAPADFVLTPEARPAVVKKLFDRKFPPGTRFGTPLPPPPMVAPPPPPRPAGNIVQRVIDYVTQRKQRELAAYEAAQKKMQDDYLKEVRAVAATGLPVEEMEGRLAQAVEITPDELHALADARARTVRDYLINEGKIAAERLFLTQPVAPVVAAEAEEGKKAEEAAASLVPEAKGPRVFLELQ